MIRFIPFGFRKNKKEKKEFVVEWTETHRAVVEAKDVDEAVEKYHKNELKRTDVPEKYGFSIEKL